MEEIEHLQEEQEFRMILKSDKKGPKSDKFAVLQYEQIEPGVFELYHTEVPAEFRGRGFAASLASRAFEELTRQDSTKKLVLTCSYLQQFYLKNKDDYKGKNIVLE